MSTESSFTRMPSESRTRTGSMASTTSRDNQTWSSWFGSISSGIRGGSDASGVSKWYGRSIDRASRASSVEDPFREASSLIRRRTDSCMGASPNPHSYISPPQPVATRTRAGSTVSQREIENAKRDAKLKALREKHAPPFVTNAEEVKQQKPEAGSDGPERIDDDDLD